MRILSIVDSALALGVPDLAPFFGRFDWKYPDPVPSYFLPKDSGMKVALARIIATLMLKQGPVLLWITETGAWPSSEHMDLFKGYRLSRGEARPLPDSPVHIFDSQEDSESLISILYLCLAFVWDVEIFTLDRSLAITISHDEWLEYRFAPGHEDIVSEFRQWVEPSLKLGAATSL